LFDRVSSERIHALRVKTSVLKEIAPMFKRAFVLTMKHREGSEIQVSERQLEVCARVVEM